MWDKYFTTCALGTSPKCEKVFVTATTEDNWGRCTQCEIEHKEWRDSIIWNKEKSIFGEWTRHTNSEKEEFSKEILQPLKKDGTINKHFIQAHGTKSIEKEYKLTESQIKENVERYG